MRSCHHKIKFIVLCWAISFFYSSTDSASSLGMGPRPSSRVTDFSTFLTRISPTVRGNLSSTYYLLLLITPGKLCQSQSTKLGSQNVLFREKTGRTSPNSGRTWFEVKYFGAILQMEKVTHLKLRFGQQYPLLTMESFIRMYSRARELFPKVFRSHLVSSGTEYECEDFSHLWRTLFYCRACVMLSEFLG